MLHLHSSLMYLGPIMHARAKGLLSIKLSATNACTYVIVQDWPKVIALLKTNSVLTKQLRVFEAILEVVPAHEARELMFSCVGEHLESLCDTAVL